MDGLIIPEDSPPTEEPDRELLPGEVTALILRLRRHYSREFKGHRLGELFSDDAGHIPQGIPVPLQGEHAIYNANIAGNMYGSELNFDVFYDEGDPRREQVDEHGLMVDGEGLRFKTNTAMSSAPDEVQHIKHMLGGRIEASKVNRLSTERTLERMKQRLEGPK